jgi:primosomal protein N'
MLARRAQQYPPYTFLTSVQISSKNEAWPSIPFTRLPRMFKKQLSRVTILGPVSPFIHFEKEVHHRVLLLKYKSDVEIKNHLRKLLVALQSKGQINVAINVDPYNF